MQIIRIGYLENKAPVRFEGAIGVARHVLVLHGRVDHGHEVIFVLLGKVVEVLDTVGRGGVGVLRHHDEGFGEVGADDGVPRVCPAFVIGAEAAGEIEDLQVVERNDV
jgi:hypothetical protein